MIVFISCTKKKINKRCKVKELYTASAWFRKAYKYAVSLNPIYIYILSAKYGLLNENDIIEPYEKTLHGAKENEVKIWSAKVISQMKEKGINFEDKAIFLCGKNYRKYLIPKFTNYEAPISHLGIGAQMKWLEEHTK